MDRTPSRIDSTAQPMQQTTQTSKVSERSIDKKAVRDCFRQCQAKMATAASVERVAIDGSAPPEKTVENIRTAITGLSTAIDEATKIQQGLHRLSLKQQRDPQLQASIRELEGKISEMETRKKRLEGLVEGDNATHLTKMVTAKRSINERLDHSKAKPAEAGEDLSCAQETLDNLRRETPATFPLAAEINTLQKRIDARALNLKITKQQQAAMSNPTNGKKMILARQGLFIMMAQHRAYLKVPANERPAGYPTKEPIDELYKKLNQSDIRNKGGQPFITNTDKGLYAQFGMAIENSPPPQPSTGTEKPAVQLTLYAPMTRSKPGHASKIAKAMDKVAGETLKNINRTIDAEARTRAGGSVDPKKRAAFTALEGDMQTLEGQLKRLENELVAAEADPNLGKPELLAKTRRQIAEARVQLQALRNKRLQLIESFPTDVQTIIRKRDHIAALTKPRLLTTEVKRRARLAEAAAEFEALDDLLKKGGLGESAKAIAEQERAAAVTMIQQAYGKEQQKVQDAAKGDRKITEALNVPMTDLVKRPADLGDYVGRGLMQLAVLPELSQLTPPQRDEVAHNIERVRALMPEADWQKLIQESPTAAPFAAAYERRRADFPHVQPLEETRQIIVRNSAQRDLYSLRVAHTHLATLKRLATPGLETTVMQLETDLMDQVDRLVLSDSQKADMSEWLNKKTVPADKFSDFVKAYEILLMCAVHGANRTSGSKGDLRNVRAFMQLVAADPALKTYIEKTPTAGPVRDLLTNFQGDRLPIQQGAWLSSADPALDIGSTKTAKGAPVEFREATRGFITDLHRVRLVVDDPSFQALGTPAFQKKVSAYSESLKKIEAYELQLQQQVTEAAEGATNRLEFQNRLVKLYESNPEYIMLLEEANYQAMEIENEYSSMVTSDAFKQWQAKHPDPVVRTISPQALKLGATLPLQRVTRLEKLIQGMIEGEAKAKVKKVVPASDDDRLAAEEATANAVRDAEDAARKAELEPLGRLEKTFADVSKRNNAKIAELQTKAAIAKLIDRVSPSLSTPFTGTTRKELSDRLVQYAEASLTEQKRLLTDLENFFIDREDDQGLQDLDSLRGATPTKSYNRQVYQLKKQLESKGDLRSTEKKALEALANSAIKDKNSAYVILASHLVRHQDGMASGMLQNLRDGPQP
jgi:hypothetical protein